MKKLILLVAFAAISFINDLTAQVEKPKLIVGIIVDQMRVDYLYRFEDKFSDDGFKRMMREGFFGRNTHYNYIPTYTGPGHASVFSGTTPSVHGIIANDWYAKSIGKRINCVDDSTTTTVGRNSGGKSYSPINLLSSNFADELKIATQGKAEVIGVSIKNRGAILPSGHFPDGAYWFDQKSGDFVTSSYYRERLPGWVIAFNKRKLASTYMSGTWEPLLPLESYTESGPDESPYEARLGNADNPTFPYDLNAIWKKDGDFGALRQTPYGNTLVAELAKAAIAGQQMGKDDVTDLLTVSFSSTDYIGHLFGPDAKEIEDCYIRLDRDLAAFFKYLDQEVGKGQYTVFLTADHAVAQVPQFLIDKKVPAGYIKRKPIQSILMKGIVAKYGEAEWIENVSNDQIFLNQEVLNEKGINKDDFMNDMAEILLQFQGIKNVFKGTDMNTNEYTTGIRAKLQRGYNVKRSGDLLLVYEPGWFQTGYGKTGTTHGSGYNYDTHVPLLMYGKGIPAGHSSVRPISITDIVPTLCMLFEVNLPNGATGQPIEEVFQNK
ncbi:MAG: alkaline phosphatase PafA [Bacteroidota bacterium]